MKPYTKQRPFFKRSSARKKSDSSSANGDLPLEFLDRLSVFETLRAYNGLIFSWEKHFERLGGSCRALNEALPLKERELRDWLVSSLKESGHKDASLRVAVHWDGRGGGRLVLFIRPFLSHPPAWYEEGVALRTAVSRRWTLKAQDPQVKASQYVSGVLAFLDKGALEAHELLFFGAGGTVAEGTVSNIFIVKGKRLLTPSVAQCRDRFSPKKGLEGRGDGADAARILFCRRMFFDEHLIRGATRREAGRTRDWGRKARTADEDPRQ